MELFFSWTKIITDKILSWLAQLAGFEKRQSGENGCMNRENMSTIGAADDVVINVGKITLFFLKKKKKKISML